eukprot:416227-Rhodomonas_salina.2
MARFPLVPDFANLSHERWRCPVILPSIGVSLKQKLDGGGRGREEGEGTVTGSYEKLAKSVQ